MHERWPIPGDLISILPGLEGEVFSDLNGDIPPSEWLEGASFTVTEGRLGSAVFECNGDKFIALQGAYSFVEDPIEVGDRVKILDIQTLSARYGYDPDGDVSIPDDDCFFCRSMTDLSGMELTVSEIVPIDGFSRNVLRFEEETLFEWTITAGMVRIVTKRREFNSVQIPDELLLF